MSSTEIARLQQELQQQQILVKQLSEELFRLVKGNIGFVPDRHADERHQAEMAALQEKLKAATEALHEARLASDRHEREAIALRQAVQEHLDRIAMLEQTVEEMPQIYRQKFAERMVPIEEKVRQLQQENRQLHIELQSLNYRLATRTRRPNRLELPSMGHA